MPKVMTKEDVKRIQFYQMPKVFFSDSKYSTMRNESKLAYMLLQDLLPLSIQNNWVNKEGEVFVKLSRAKLMSLLNIKGTQKIAQVMKELVDYGLIIYKRIGLTKCNEIYICLPDMEEDTEEPVDKKGCLTHPFCDTQLWLQKSQKGCVKHDIIGKESRTFLLYEKRPSKPVDIQKCEDEASDSNEIHLAEIPESNIREYETQTHINTNSIKTNYNKTNINQSIHQEDETEGLEELSEHFSNLLHTDYLTQQYDEGMVEEIINNICDMHMSKTTPIHGQSMPRTVIRGVLGKLKMHHVEHVINQFLEASGQYEIRHTKRYLQTLIYNSIFEASSKIRGRVRYDLGY